MDLTLLTYDCCVAHNAGYACKSSAIEFAKVLNKIAKAFAKEVGVKESDVYWWEIRESDWCKNMLIIFATVPKDWQPTKKTFIYDDYANKLRPELARNLDMWVKGGGYCIDLNKQPAQNPHNLFRSKQSE